MAQVLTIEDIEEEANLYCGRLDEAMQTDNPREIVYALVDIVELQHDFHKEIEKVPGLEERLIHKLDIVDYHAKKLKTAEDYAKLAMVYIAALSESGVRGCQQFFTGNPLFHSTIEAIQRIGVLDIARALREEGNDHYLRFIEIASDKEVGLLKEGSLIQLYDRMKSDNKFTMAEIKQWRAIAYVSEFSRDRAYFNNVICIVSRHLS